MGMRVVDYNAMEQRLVEGIKGSLTALDVVGDESFGVGLRIVPAHSKVPKPSTPFARGRRVLFVLRGSGTISNGEYYEKLTAGKFVVLDEAEHPHFATQDEELMVLEARYDPLGKMAPPALTVTVPVPEPRPAAKATSYDSI